MIRLAETRRSSSDGVVPMINVAFLLLVFFLMTAVIVPPDPIDVAPPAAKAEPSGEDADTLYVGPNGELALGDARGSDVFRALPDGPLRIRADGSLDGATLTQIVSRLADAGMSEVRIVVLPR